MGTKNEKNGRILVVEDDHATRNHLKTMLNDEGYDVLEARHGLEALQQLSTDPEVDMIFLDLMMPVMSGWRLHRALQAHPVLGRVPVVLLSHNTVHEASDALDVQGIISKPIQDADVLNTVKELAR